MSIAKTDKSSRRKESDDSHEVEINRRTAAELMKIFVQKEHTDQLLQFPALSFSLSLSLSFSRSRRRRQRSRSPLLSSGKHKTGALSASAPGAKWKNHREGILRAAGPTF